MKRIKSTAKILGFLLSVFLLVGCVAQKTQKIQTAEQQPVTTKASDTTAMIPGERQINEVSEANKYWRKKEGDWYGVDMRIDT